MQKILWKRFVVGLAIGSLLSLLFYFVPNIDLYFSQLFYNSKTHFHLEKYILITILDYSAKVFGLVILCTAIILALRKFRSLRSLNPKYYIKYIYIVLIIVAGPVIIVDQVLKDNSGRARPYQTKEFGGQKEFSGAYHYSSECTKNCSFVSAHAAFGFCFVCFAFIFGTQCTKRYYFEMVGIFLGLFFGFIRIMQGKHFLSDIVICGVFMYLFAVVMAIIMKPYREFK